MGISSTRADAAVWLRIGIIAVVLAATVAAVAALFGIRFGYTLQIVALGGAALGVVSGVIGSYAVLRGQSLLGDGISHAALPGVGVAFLIAGRETGALLIGAGAGAECGHLFHG